MIPTDHIWLARFNFFDIPSFSQLAHVLLVVVALFVLTAVLRFRMHRHTNIVPYPGFSFLNIFELFTEKTRHLCDEIIGAGGERYVSLAGTMFLFIAISNVLGFIPGFDSPTAHINTAVALAAIVFFVTHGVGIQTHGRHYFRMFLGPVGGRSIYLIAPLIFFVELLNFIVRPAAMGLRLSAVVTTQLVAHNTLTYVAQYAVPVLSMAFGVFISIAHAYIFVILSLVYISLAGYQRTQ